MATVVVKGLEQTLRILRDFEPELYKQLRDELKGVLQPLASKIETAAPKISPFAGRRKDGMSHNGRTAYKGMTAKPEITPLSYRGSNGTRRIASIVSAGKDSVGFDIIEMAGKTTRGKTKSGQALIENLRGKPPRYTYPNVEAMMPQVEKDILGIVQTASTKINRRLDVV